MLYNHPFQSFSKLELKNSSQVVPLSTSNEPPYFSFSSGQFIENEILFDSNGLSHISLTFISYFLSFVVNVSSNIDSLVPKP